MFGWLVIAGLLISGLYIHVRRVARRLASPFGEGIAVLIPIKGVRGHDVALRRFLASCLVQRGVSYRLIFAIEAESDPASAALARLVACDSRASLVIAGQAIDRGQKVHNQLAALATLSPTDRFIVFADADTVLAPDWLAQLLRPLLLGHTELATGYRWLLPADHQLASRLCALIDWSIATSPRSKHLNLCWGGSMAVSRSALDQIDLPCCWDRALADDMVLTRAARRAGVLIN